MINNRIRLFLAFLLMAYASQLSAQFNPSNPAEPNMSYKVTLAVEPAGVAWTSGEGAYANGDDVWISTSANNPNYVFDYWDKNGVFYDTLQSTHFVIAGDNVRFTAHYKYAPVNPDEPESRYFRRIYLKSQPEGAASFSQSSGEKYLVGSGYDVCTYGETGYVFIGWYIDTLLISKTIDLSYTVPDNDITLTARFKYAPDNPTEPIPFIIGDANGSGMVNVADITTVVSHIFGNTPSYFKTLAADVNNTGTINVADIAGIVNIIYGTNAPSRTTSRSQLGTAENAVTLQADMTAPGGEAELFVGIENPTIEFSSFELNLHLPEGISVINSSLSHDRTGERSFVGAYVGNVYKIMSYSMDNRPFTGHEGTVAVVKLKADEKMSDGVYEISATDIVLSNMGDEINVKSTSFGFKVSVDSSVLQTNDETESIEGVYDLTGHRVNADNLDGGIYIVRFNGGKKPIKIIK